MTKKTTATVPATEILPVSEAIAADIEANLGANASGAEVAQSFDHQFGALNWYLLKGNSSAKACGLSKEEFKLVNDARIEYRDAWKAAGLPNFDRRWQYVKSLSVYAPQPEEPETTGEGEGEGEGEGDSGSAKTKLEQCITALQNALRYATHEEFDGNLKTADKIRAALKANGIAEGSAE